ncbi:hypothetical protein Salat_1690300 [Sesamum alatum]|uniref:Uncharacterized protein n=1 Tax=Sesamum alatum TaxID=300844 RepID=A0AAE2CK00_9LAMI|nr:hypothetical protein Salat_1690300 [Sesamum alatum]
MKLIPENRGDLPLDRAYPAFSLSWLDGSSLQNLLDPWVSLLAAGHGGSQAWASLRMGSLSCEGLLIHCGSTVPCLVLGQLRLVQLLGWSFYPVGVNGLRAAEVAWLTGLFSVWRPSYLIKITLCFIDVDTNIFIL